MGDDYNTLKDVIRCNGEIIDILFTVVKWISIYLEFYLR